jgi:site-specific DNA-methyltransferase (adenine-specific)
MQLYHGDCLKVMDELIEKGIKVDMILCDPPYGSTRCKWDTIIPLDEMWERINKLIKLTGAILIFGSEPFSSTLRCSNIKNYKYDWIWIKEQGTNQLNAKKQPLRNTELISVFYKKQCIYHPQMTKGTPYSITRSPKSKHSEIYNEQVDSFTTINNGERYPLTTIYFNREIQSNKRFHPTQKPVDLLEYLIRTYTNENELVLDFTMGSGSTGVACMNVNRRFIGIELEEKYFDISINRIFENYSNNIN